MTRAAGSESHSKESIRNGMLIGEIVSTSAIYALINSGTSGIVRHVYPAVARYLSSQTGGYLDRRSYHHSARLLLNAIRSTRRRMS